MKSGCYIGTGYKRVLHTLWEESTHDEVFIKNLPRDTEKAIAIAKKYAKEHELNFMGVQASPSFGKAKHLDQYDIVFKHKRKHTEDGFKEYYYGEATPKFWDAWRKDKEAMKKKGFRVSKYAKRDFRSRTRVETWYVFYTPQEA